MASNPQDIDQHLDLDRTNKLFDISIVKSGAEDVTPYDEKSLRASKLTLGFGNLHVNTAKTKVGILRLIGYQDNLKKIKDNVSRKLRNAKKYGKNR